MRCALFWCAALLAAAALVCGASGAAAPAFQRGEGFREIRRVAWDSRDPQFLRNLLVLYDEPVLLTDVPFLAPGNKQRWPLSEQWDEPAKAARRLLEVIDGLSTTPQQHKGVLRGVKQSAAHLGARGRPNVVFPYCLSSSALEVDETAQMLACRDQREREPLPPLPVAERVPISWPATECAKHTLPFEEDDLPFTPVVCAFRRKCFTRLNMYADRFLQAIGHDIDPGDYRAEQAKLKAEQQAAAEAQAQAKAAAAAAAKAAEQSSAKAVEVEVSVTPDAAAVGADAMAADSAAAVNATARAAAADDEPVEQDEDEVVDTLTPGAAYGWHGYIWKSLRDKLDVRQVMLNESYSTRGRFKTTMWAAANGAVTPLHGDVVHNVFMPLTGSKRFRFFDPHSHRHIGLFPALHPGALQCVDTDAAMLLPAVQGINPIVAYDTVVSPGQALFIPALWFHHVTTLSDASWAVNVWSDSEAARLADEVKGMGLGPLPDEPRWRADTPSALRAFLFLLLEDKKRLKLAQSGSAEPEQTYKDWLVRNVLHARYLAQAPVMERQNFTLAYEQTKARVIANFNATEEEADKAGREAEARSRALTAEEVAEFGHCRNQTSLRATRRYCHNATATKLIYADPSFKWKLSDTVRDVTEIFAKIPIPPDRHRPPPPEPGMGVEPPPPPPPAPTRNSLARRDIFLADYVERVVAQALGATAVQQFLYDLAFC